MNRNYSHDNILSSSSTMTHQQQSSYQPTFIGGQYNPLCFSKESFTSDAFKVDAFIADCRKRVPLESVQKDLREYAKCLDSELVELINREYHSFFSLSSSLLGIDVVLNEFNDTLSSIKSEISVM
ncbi:hypothetical protein SAMD00019534_045380 [Acytostelium subglobosum LB1]|uniref:hypothetical protein n=1 Tax=Acytostelium subglobosum LB1 TaxID=1410327 RepID=UPI00064511D5|nr:hypothetical protein SAMD00019534_045380 [Acytostelium subglobosum LB1]GAM21363.1 hypothetical protein SAMD00019534_045380 [Acytostelium subglobosum LB1]|eukprot:XP_012755482.1 hypothetical protein SAMD00019534_045380 [Acytostelium subglobosum LB1]